MRLIIPSCKICTRFIFMLLGIFVLTGYTLAQDQAAVPSIVLGKVKGCQHAILRIKYVPGCAKVDLDQIENQLITNAKTDLNKVLRSSEFKAAVQQAKFDPKQMIRKCDGDLCNVQLTNQQIYDLLVSTSPKTINVTFYQYATSFTAGNQGFEDPKNFDTLYGNRKQINGSRGFLASLMLHELMHLLGFQHLDKPTKYISVPYTMNNVYSTVSAQLKMDSPKGYN